MATTIEILPDEGTKPKACTECKKLFYTFKSGCYFPHVAQIKDAVNVSFIFISKPVRIYKIKIKEL